MLQTEISELGKRRINAAVQHLPVEQWHPSWLPHLNNTSHRSRLIEYIGYEKALSFAGHKVDEGRDNYVLWKLEGINDDRNGYALFLGMVCPSTNHHHLIRVPPTVTNVEEALLYINHDLQEFIIQT